MNNFERQALQNILSKRAKAEHLADANLAKLRENKKFFDLESQYIYLSIKTAKADPKTDNKLPFAELKRPKRYVQGNERTRV